MLTLDGKPVAPAEATRLFRYHKPAGLLTTHVDPKGRPTVFESLPAGLPRLISIGRLDLSSEGLLLLTNDGALARAMELPASGLARRYRARARGRFDAARLAKLASGITVAGVRYGSIEARLDREEEAPAPANRWITLLLAEGKNREVRRVLEALDLMVSRLIRIGYGPFVLGDLQPGEIEEVDPARIRAELGRWIAPESLPSGERSGKTLRRLASPLPASRPRERAPSPRPPRAPEPATAKPVYKPGWARPKIKSAGPGRPKRSRLKTLPRP